MLSIIIFIMGDERWRVRNFRLALKCIQQQTFRNFELIIVEQYVGDQPLWKEEVESLCDTYVAITENALPHWGRFSLPWCKNVGARVANYDILVMLDADMVYGTDYFSQIVETFNLGMGYLMGYNQIRWLSEKGTGVYTASGYHMEWEQGLSTKTTYPGWTGGCGGGGSVIFSKRFYFDVLGCYSENYYGWGKEDKDILFRAHRLMDLPGNKVQRLDYELLHLYHRRGGHLAVGAGEHYFQYTRRYPHRVCYLLVEAKLGDVRGVKSIDLSRLDLPSAGYLERTRPLLTQEEHTEVVAGQNIKYSFKDFTNQAFFKATDLNGSIILNSRFYQDAGTWDNKDKDPRVEIFPSDMTGVTFIECNLDNVCIPPGNVVDPLCYCRRVNRQYDGELWILNAGLYPVEPLHEDFLLEAGRNVLPKKIPKFPPRK